MITFSKTFARLSDNFLTQRINSLFVLIILAYIVCAMNLPVSIYTNAGHDDALFISHAYSILKGEWLGTYSQMTLAKGVGFSLFLAANAVLGIPITLFIAIFYAFSVWCLVTKCIRLGLPKIAALFFFALLLFHPDIFPARIIRDNIYPALTLLVLTAFIDICLLHQRRLSLIFLYGLAIAWFWVTREEGVWIVPAMALLVLYRVISCLLFETRSTLVNFFTRITILCIFISLPILTICAINYIKYGAFLTVDFKDTPFSKSLSLLNSIEANSRISHVPVNREQREIAYSVSPAFAELKPYFEETGTDWTKPGCNIYPQSCGDYAGGWFMWAYRDAVQQRGYYKNYSGAREFYQRVADEINDACEAGKISCNKKSIGFLPNLSSDQLDGIPNSIVKSYKLLTVQYPVSLDAGPSIYADGRLNMTKIFLRNPFIVPSMEEDTRRINGWYYDPASTDNWITLECSNKSQVNNGLIERIHSQDVAVAMDNPLATKQRFSFNVPARDTCRIINSNDQNISLDHIYQTNAGAFSLGSATLYIDSVISAIPSNLYKASSTLKQGIAAFYKVIIPLLFWIALCMWFFTFIRYLLNRAWPPALFICALVAWGLVFTRIVILTLIDISSFPAINALYMGPAFPLVIAAIFLSIFSFRNFSRN
jgi:hypothetical protein